MDAVVLAGGVNRIPLFEGDVPGAKALLPFAGRPAMAYTLEALRAAGVARIGVVGPEAVQPLLQDEVLTPGGETLLESLRAGLRLFPESAEVLVATADMPLITAAAVTAFLDACGPASPLRLCLSLVPSTCYSGPYAAFTKGFNRFRDVAVCHGNLALVSPTLFDHPTASRRLNALYDARKDPVQAALAVGMRVGLSYILGVHLTHTLTLAQMAAVASRRFGIDIQPVLIDHPEITIDVDEPADYAFVCRQLRQELRRLPLLALDIYARMVLCPPLPPLCPPFAPPLPPLFGFLSLGGQREFEVRSWKYEYCITNDCIWWGRNRLLISPSCS